MGIIWTDDMSGLEWSGSGGPEMMPNGTFDVDTTGWTAGASTTIDRVTTPVADGAGALRLTRNTTTGSAVVNSSLGTNGMPVGAGRDYTITWKHRRDATARNTYMAVYWWTSDGSQVSSDVGTLYADSTSYQSRSRTVTAPATAAFLSLQYGVVGCAANEIHYLDTVSVTGPVFDSDGWTAGTGTTLDVLSGGLRTTRSGSPAVASKTVTGLTIGRKYTLTAKVREAVSGQVDGAYVGISGIGNGSTINPTTSDSTATYTFTATATSHTVVLTATDTGATTDARWDDVSLYEFSDPNPPALTTRTPFQPDTSATFAWTFSDPDAGDTQSAYEIDIATDSGFTNIVYNGAKVPSSTQSMVLPANTLAKNTSYYWRVRTWDSDDYVSDWSSTGTFTTLGNPTFTGWVVDAAETVKNSGTIYDTNQPGFVFNSLNLHGATLTSWTVTVTGPTNWSDTDTSTPPSTVWVDTPLANGSYTAVMQVITSGGSATANISFTISVKNPPSFTPLVIGGPTYTDTSAATLGFGSIDLDGLPVDSWSIVVRENDGSGTIVWTASGGAGSTPPASIVTDLLPNGFYWVGFTITTNYAAAGTTLSTTETAEFAIVAPQTVIVTDWSAPRTLPADCVDPEDACSFYYRARLVGTVDGQPAITGWVVADGVLGEPVPVIFVEDDVIEDDAVVTLSDGGNTVHVTATPPNSDALGGVLPFPFQGTYGLSARVEIDQTPDESAVFLGYGEAGMYYHDGGLYDGLDNLLVAYDPVDHAYWRVLSYSGTATFQASPDGLTWTTLGTLTTAAPVVKAVAVIGATGTDDTIDATISEIMSWPLVPVERTFTWTEGEHLLRAMTPDGPVFHSGCGQITWTVSRPFTVASGLAGGRQVSSGAPGGHDITLSLAVTSQEDLESLEGVLERPLVLVSPADSDEQWSAPIGASVQVVKVGRIRTVGAQLIGTGPEPDPEVT